MGNTINKGKGYESKKLQWNKAKKSKISSEYDENYQNKVYTGFNVRRRVSTSICSDCGLDVIFISEDTISCDCESNEVVL